MGSFVDTSEVELLAADLAVASTEGVEAMRTVISQGARDTVNQMKNEAPSDSGRLRRSISYRLDDDRLGAEVGPTATDSKGRPYPFFVEYGTSDTAPDPFVRRTAGWVERTLPKRAADAIEGLFE